MPCQTGLLSVDKGRKLQRWQGLPAGRFCCMVLFLNGWLLARSRQLPCFSILVHWVPCCFRCCFPTGRLVGRLRCKFPVKRFISLLDWSHCHGPGSTARALAFRICHRYREAEL